ncbi:glycosyltransferase family 2 protein [bacterium]|nr:glycosyltransferase family 2 protein [bacterium]
MKLPYPYIPPEDTPPNPDPGLVSIIIPTYNCAATLPRAIASLKAQTYPRTEIIVSDDASTDDTARVVCALGLTYLRQEKNAGAAVARNEGARAAKGDIFFFAEADGYYDADYVEKIVRHLHLPDVVGATNVGRRVWTDRDNVLVRHQNDLLEAAGDLVLAGKRGTGAWAFTRDAFFSVNGYDPVCRIGQDVDLVLRLLARGGRTVVGGRSTLYHKDPDTLRAYMRRAYRGALHSGVVAARWRGLSGGWQKLFYTIRFALIAALPLYAAGAFAWHPVFWLPFAAGIAYLIFEDRTTTRALYLTARRGDVATFIATPSLLYLRRLAIGWGRVNSFLPQRPKE